MPYDEENSGGDHLLTLFILKCQLECLQRHDWLIGASISDADGFEVTSAWLYAQQGTFTWT